MHYEQLARTPIWRVLFRIPVEQPLNYHSLSTQTPDTLLLYTKAAFTSSQVWLDYNTSSYDWKLIQKQYRNILRNLYSTRSKLVRSCIAVESYLWRVHPQLQDSCIDYNCVCGVNSETDMTTCNNKLRNGHVTSVHCSVSKKPDHYN